MTETSSPPALPRRTVLQGAGLAALLAAANRIQNTQAQEGVTSERAMRRADLSIIDPNHRPPNPGIFNIVANRMGYGIRPGQYGEWTALGSNDDERLSAYVEQQINPQSIDDSECDARLVQENYTTLSKTVVQLWAEHLRNDDYNERIRPIREVTKATYLRGFYSKRQFQEVLADFWHNHFNTYGWDYYAAALFPHYDRDVIRGHIFGNFRQFIEAVGMSPVMLYYLDNQSSSDSGPNENYARELFELHGLGAENYLGVMPPETVPVDGNGIPIGYCDNDVYEAARCFTGWRVADGSYDTPDTGAFYYKEDWHDRFQKVVLGFPPHVPFIPANQPPLKDGRDVYDRLARHPGTGRYICRKLIRRFISDSAPESLVQEAAAVFTANVDAPDQLAKVYRVIFTSDAFKNTWGEKVKRPFENLISYLRAINVRYYPGTDNPWWYSSSGQIPFNWRSPNGYPDEKEDWTSTMPMLQRWRAINRIATGVDELPDLRANLVQQSPSPASATQLADVWIGRVLGRTMENLNHRQEIIDFMADGFGPTVPIDLSIDENGERLVNMVALIACCPDFNYR